MKKQEITYTNFNDEEVTVTRYFNLSKTEALKLVNGHGGMDKYLADVAEKKPDVVYVAMGSPKQEFLMADMMAQHKAIYQGLGGSFDVYAGRVKRAPLWWQKHNLEFLYRFLKQPQRYRREYYRLKFLAWMMMGKFNKK